MKRFLFLAFLAIIGRFAQPVHAQPVPIMPTEVIDVGANAILSATHLDQVIYYGQAIAQAGLMLENTITMAENYGEQLKRTWQNLSSLDDVKSYDDFMDWYNRQLYYDRTVKESYNSITVTIGKSNYKLSDLEGWGNGLQDALTKKFWEEEFTEEQRKEMWLGLGLTPANYAYVLPFRQQANDIAKRFLVASDIENAKYMAAMEQNKKYKDKLAKDNLLELDDKMGEKQIQMIIADTAIANNEALRDLIMLMTDMMEMKAAEYYLDQTPSDAPSFSEWNRGFTQMDKRRP
jgi:hypothetical protein